MKVKVIPAVIAKSQQELGEKVNLVQDFVDCIQLDVMDGVFVPNESLHFDFRLPKIHCEFEAHLMVDNPDNWVKRNWQKVDTVLIPIESCKNPGEIIGFLGGKNPPSSSMKSGLRRARKKIGFALNPETPLKEIKDYLDEIDQVLIMTVSPGFYGAEFLPECLEKVRRLRKLKPDLDIEVDGGINLETIKMAFEAGANFFVSGSYIMNSKNPKAAIKTLKSIG